MDPQQFTTSSVNLTTTERPLTPQYGGEWRPIPVLFWVFLALLDTLIIFGNAFFCWLFIRYKNLRHNSNYFVLSLAIGDFLVGMCVPPCEYCAVLEQPPIECGRFCGTVLSFNMAASVMNLSLIAYDRVLAIKFPFRYHASMTRRKVYKLIAVAWLIACACATLPLIWGAIAPPDTTRMIDHVYTVAMFSVIFVIGILIHIAYYLIIKEAREKARTSVMRGYSRQGDAAGLKVCLVLATLFLVCWIPQAVFELSIEFQWDSVFPRWSFDVFYFILLLNPCLDPLLYAYYKQEFRSAVKQQVTHWRDSIPCLQNYASLKRNNTKQNSKTDSAMQNNPKTEITRV